MRNFEYEENQNKAFATLITNSVEYMKGKGATDLQIRILIDDAILGIINTIQDHKIFSNHVYNIIKETSETKSVCELRQTGMMCELLDRIEDSIQGDIYKFLGYANEENQSEHIIERNFDFNMDDILGLIVQMKPEDISSIQDEDIYN